MSILIVIMMHNIDLRSDTVTHPTDTMREAMARAMVGDDVYGDDPTVNELEMYAASLTGKEAALFVPSGTFGNQLALFTHCSRGDEVILDDSCHIIHHEVGAPAVIAGVNLRAIESVYGVMPINTIVKKIRVGTDIHEPKTGLICIENAHSSGRVLPLSFIEELKYVSSRYHVPIHMDGARIFNAATVLKVAATELTKHVDSVMFCLSKGLCSPVGSLLAGSADFIEHARKKRKLLGGGMRQVGILAAAGLISLREMRLRLDEDHKNARYLAEQLATIPQLAVQPENTEINMVFFKIAQNNIDPSVIAEYFQERGIIINPPASNGMLRFVTHYWITKKDIDKTIEVMRAFFAD